MEPLNDMLYRALNSKFPVVKIANQGEHATIIYSPDWDRKGRLQADVISPGEYYCVDCCYCSDTRTRLWINHRWGVYDPKTGDHNLHLAHCFNEDCVNSSIRQRDLQMRLMVPGPMTIRPTQKTQMPVPLKTFTLPEGMILVNQLADDHPAASYLQARGFDLDELATRFGVGYVDYAATQPPLYNRIVIPVYRPRIFSTKTSTGCHSGDILAGWMARTITDQEPKYLAATGMAKSQVLYNLPAARRSIGPIVVVEGATDVWRIGPNAVGLLGKSMSRTQKELLVRHFVGRPIVILLDSDAQAEAQAIHKELAAARSYQAGPVVVAQLPAGVKDPGDCTRNEIQAVVDAALKSVPTHAQGRALLPSAALPAAMPTAGAC